MTQRLTNQAALITGGAGGIGRSCAEAFIREGARVVIADRDAAAGRTTAEALRQSGAEVHFVEADVGEPESVAALIETTVQYFGQLNIVVSNAGIGGRRLGDGPTHLCSVEAWDQVLNVNLRGTFLVCKYALPHLQTQRGCIVTIASVLGLVGTQGLFDTHAYATSKAGIIGLTRTIAAHYARDGVRANAVAPGLIDTQMAARTKADPTIAEQVAFWQPLGGLGQPQDVAAAVTFLASAEAQFITGITLAVDGGWTAQ